MSFIGAITHSPAHAINTTKDESFPIYDAMIDCIMSALIRIKIPKTGRRIVPNPQFNIYTALETNRFISLKSSASLMLLTLESFSLYFTLFTPLFDVAILIKLLLIIRYTTANTATIIKVKRSIETTSPSPLRPSR